MAVVSCILERENMAFPVNFTAQGKAGCCWNSLSPSVSARDGLIPSEFQLLTFFFGLITLLSIHYCWFQLLLNMEASHSKHFITWIQTGFSIKVAGFWFLSIVIMQLFPLTMNNEIFLSGWNLCSHWFLSYPWQYPVFYHRVCTNCLEIKVSIIIWLCPYSLVLSLFHTVVDSMMWSEITWETAVKMFAVQQIR